MDGETEKATETPYERGVRLADTLVMKWVGDVGITYTFERVQLERESVEFFVKDSSVNRGMYDAYSGFLTRHSLTTKPGAEWLDRPSREESSSSRNEFLF